MFMRFWKRLQNPFALVGQGFVVGGLMFWTTQAHTHPAPIPPADAGASIIVAIQPAR